MKILLKNCLLMHLKLNDKQILKYMVEESEICELLISKLADIYQKLPKEIDLLTNPEMDEEFPDDADSKYISIPPLDNTWISS